MAAQKTSSKQKKTTTQSLSEGSKKSKTPTAKNQKIIVTALVILVFICIAIIGTYYFLQYKKAQQGPLLTTQMTQTELTAKVGQLISLPTGEQPTIASVSDITKLKGQPFFTNARNGDIVLVYPKAGEAILYDPFVNKIIQVGPVDKQQQSSPKTAAVPAQGAVAGAQTIAEPVTVALYNGTTIPRLTQKITTELTQMMPDVTVMERTNAAKQTYTKTLVVDLRGNQEVAASALAKVLNGTVRNLPSGEIAPKDADILVILGDSRGAGN